MSTGSTYLRLEMISGNAPGNTIVVDDELVIGRHATGAGRLSEDEEISRQHARISREATGDYAIEDLGSSNGTFVNGLRIQSPRLLSLGDSIETGTTTLVVREIVQPAPVEAAPNAADRPASDLRHAPTVFARSPAAQQAAAVSAQEIRPAAEPAVPVESAPSTAPSPVAVEPASRNAPLPAPVEPASQNPPLALKLEVDFDAREARIALGDGGERVRIVFEDGCWRASPVGLDPDR
jgi:pSer/pThr/pTyr-binding forkhead associated (FHA) protein